MSGKVESYRGTETEDSDSEIHDAGLQRFSFILTHFLTDVVDDVNRRRRNNVIDNGGVKDEHPVKNVYYPADNRPNLENRNKLPECKIPGTLCGRSAEDLKINMQESSASNSIDSSDAIIDYLQKKDVDICGLDNGIFNNMLLTLSPKGSCKTSPRVEDVNSSAGSDGGGVITGIHGLNTVVCKTECRSEVHDMVPLQTRSSLTQFNNDISTNGNVVVDVQPQCAISSDVSTNGEDIWTKLASITQLAKEVVTKAERSSENSVDEVFRNSEIKDTLLGCLSEINIDIPEITELRKTLLSMQQPTVLNCTGIGKPIVVESGVDQKEGSAVLDADLEFVSTDEEVVDLTVENGDVPERNISEHDIKHAGQKHKHKDKIQKKCRRVKCHMNNIKVTVNVSDDNKACSPVNKSLQSSTNTNLQVTEHPKRHKHVKHNRNASRSRHKSDSMDQCAFNNDIFRHRNTHRHERSHSKSSDEKRCSSEGYKVYQCNKDEYKKLDLTEHKCDVDKNKQSVYTSGHKAVTICKEEYNSNADSHMKNESNTPQLKEGSLKLAPWRFGSSNCASESGEIISSTEQCASSVSSELTRMVNSISDNCKNTYDVITSRTDSNIYLATDNNNVLGPSVNVAANSIPIPNTFPNFVANTISYPYSWVYQNNQFGQNLCQQYPVPHQNILPYAPDYGEGFVTNQSQTVVNVLTAQLHMPFG